VTAPAQLNGANAVAAPGVSPAASAALAKARILVVDDVAVNVDLLERMLNKAGAGSVVGFTDPHEALAECQRTWPDLVLLDLHMPGLDGLQFLERLRSVVGEDGFLPVLVLTADITEEARRNVLAAGAKDFLTKPFNRIEVLLRVHNLLETGFLYARLRAHSSVLQAEIDRQLTIQRAAEERELDCLARVDDALTDDGMSIVYQPFATLADRRIVGAEALARFAATPYRPPNEWFAEAESVGRLAVLELSAIARAVTRLDELPPEAFLSLNISAATAITPECGALLAALPADRIVLEITEHSQVADYDELAAALQPFVDRGGRLAVDDAGAGFAGLQHILRLRPHIIKLDIALTSGIDRDPARRALASSLMQFAGELDATLIAEGIETAEELSVLRDLGVTWGQGYHLARPADLPLALDE
jgi:EAL domain-containing protein (putative c-di-GMP-specific phosphodiesterase class I)